MRGFTLVELLIATGLLGAIAAAGLGGLLQASKAARHIAAEQTTQERAEYALATLEADIQMAGYFGFGTPTPDTAMPQVPPLTLPCGTELLRGALRSVEVQPQYRLSCAAAGGGSAMNSPVLILRRASTRTSAAEAGRVQWYGSLIAPEHNQFFWNGMPPTAMQPAADHREIRNLVVRAFYIARGSDGDSQSPSLRVKTLSAIAGTPAFIDTEVMPGVASLQVELLPAAHPGTVRVVLGLRSDAADRGSAATSPMVLFTRHFALRNVLQN